MKTKTRKPPVRTMHYNRAVGCLLLTVDGKEFGYWIDPLATLAGQDPGPSWGALAFRLTKFVASQKPGEPDHYDVLIAPTGSASCECKGCMRHGHCKHGASLLKLRELGRLS